MSDLDFLNEDGFNASNAAEDASDGEYKPVPNGWYNVTIMSAEIAQTKAGNGTMIKTRLDISGPTHTGRVIFDQPLVKRSDAEYRQLQDGTKEAANKAATAQDIGRARFGQMCVAAGFPDKAPATHELVGKNFDVKLGIEKGSKKPDGTFYEDRNKCLAFRTAQTIVPDGQITAAGSDIPF